MPRVDNSEDEVIYWANENEINPANPIDICMTCYYAYVSQFMFPEIEHPRYEDDYAECAMCREELSEVDE